MTSRDAKRRLAYTNGNYPPIGISSRINFQPTRGLYHFRFKSYGSLCDFHWFFFKVTWRKNVTAYVKTEGTWQKRNYIRNVLQPTRSLCHFRFKSYGPLSDFHKSGDLDLALHPIVKKKSSALSRVQKTSSAKTIRTIGPSVRPVEPLKTDRQTDTHTDRGDQYTLRKVFRKVIRAAIIGYFSYYIDFNWPWPLTLTFDLWPWPSFIL